MGFAPASTIMDFWNEEVLPREQDFLQAESAICVGDFDSYFPAIRRAIDAASALAAMSDQVSAKLSPGTVIEGYHITGNLKVDQINFGKIVRSKSDSVRLLCELINTYKHGILDSSKPHFSRPNYDEARVSITLVGVASFDGIPREGKTENPIVKLSWVENNAEGGRGFGLLFSEAKKFWVGIHQLNLPF